MKHKLQDILRVVCAITGEASNDIKSPTRVDHITVARHVFCYIARRWYSSTRIGRYINRDHSTVLYAVAKVGDREQARIRAIAAQCLRMLRVPGILMNRHRPVHMRHTKKFNAIVRVGLCGHRNVRGALAGVGL